MTAFVRKPDYSRTRSLWAAWRYFRPQCVLLALGCVALIFAPVTVAAEADQIPEDLTTLSLQDLMEVEITTLSRKSERLLDAPAAVFVITQEDIRRSGAKAIPDLLRMVPGVQVAQIDSSKWAVTSRGFIGRFANKLLVLIDGRSVYTPLFSGVFWDVQDTLFADIDRIEVIRGPGATMWGANAVNGVINIITKSADTTQGGLLTVGGGSEEQAFADFRYGAAAGDDLHYRIYAKYFDRDATVGYPSEEDGDDDWDVGRAGFRLDWKAGGRDSVMTMAEIYDGDAGETLTTFSPSPAMLDTAPANVDFSGGHWLLDWSRTLGEGSSFNLKAYYERSDREGRLFSERRDTGDLEFQHRFSAGSRNDIVWGAGFRYTTDDLDSTDTILFDSSDRSDKLYSAFLQNEITVVERKLFVTLGSKVEHNDYTGWEIQPNARVQWSPVEEHAFWWSVSRSVRTPSRADEDATIRGLFGLLPAGDPQNPFPAPLVTALQGDDDLDSEELVAYEFGYRTQISAHLTLDTAFFYNDYDDLAGVMVGAPTCEPAGSPVGSDPFCVLAADFIQVPAVSNNSLEGDTRGFELSVAWRPVSRWRIQSSYTYMDMDLKSTTGEAGLGDLDMETWTPDQVLSVRSALDMTRKTELDVWLRYVDEVPGFSIPSYWTVDLRFGWELRDGVTLEVVGRNLHEDEHREFVSELGDIPPAQIERSGYAQVRWSF